MTYANRHRDFRASWRALVAAVTLTLCKLHQIQFDAPWNPQRNRC